MTEDPQDARGWAVKVLVADFDQEIMKCVGEAEKMTLIDSCESLVHLREGKRVLVRSFTGWVRGVVRIQDGILPEPYIDVGPNICTLARDGEKWVTTAMINKKCFGVGAEDVRRSIP